MLLEGKRLLITGILTDDSIAWHAARIAQEEGAEIVATGFGRGMRLTERAVQRLPKPADVLHLDINDTSDMERVAEDLQVALGSGGRRLARHRLRTRRRPGWQLPHHPAGERPDGVHHLGVLLQDTRRRTAPVAAEGGEGALVTLDFDNRQAWPAYDWMGVAKAALVSVTRYLARDLGADGIRVNAVSAGPLSTVAAKSIPGFALFEQVWGERAPLGWDLADPSPVARMVCVLLRVGGDDHR